jgi:tetratricopeptide (TPR) repeat protein
MRALVVLALAVGAAAGRPRAAPETGQAPVEEQAALEELARAYRSGLHDRAAAVAASWSAERTAREVERLASAHAARARAGERGGVALPSPDVAGLGQAVPDDAGEREVTRLAAAAIVIEAVLARLRGGEHRLAAPDLSKASLLLDAEPLGARGRPFAPRFHLLAGLVLHWHVEIAAGHALLGRALQRFPDDPELLTALGAMLESVASLRTYPPAPGSPEAPPRGSPGYRAETGDWGGVVPGATLEAARARYERALALDPALDEARLRLARVRVLEGRAEAALPDLDRVAREARQPRQRYLARLFEGSARESLGDLAGAVAACGAGLAEGPRAQTILLALGRSLGHLGDGAGAQEAFAAASIPGAPFDPWWGYQAGQPERFDDLVGQLRELVE